MRSNFQWFCLFAVYGFALLFLVFVPFPFHYFPFQAALSDFLFKDLIEWIAVFFKPELSVENGFSSDSMAMYILSGLLAFGAVLVVIFVGLANGSVLKNPKLYAWMDRIFIAYLSLIWFRYGFEKVFKHQFYLPEPNILFTPFGNLDPDILFWSFMGTSYSYNLILGFLELLAGTFILFKTTRFAGLLLSLVILIQVLAINLCFDISLKLFTTFLLLLVLLLLRSKIEPLYLFLFRNQFRPVKEYTLQWPFGWVKAVLKTLFVFMLLFENIAPYAATANWNDDLSQRPFLHGAYEVAKGSNKRFPVKRFFIHRDGYLIFQFENEEMEDFRLRINPGENELICIDNQNMEWHFSYQFSARDSVLMIESLDSLQPLQLKAKSINWRKLPALSPSFHWTMEGHFSDSTTISEKAP